MACSIVGVSAFSHDSAAVLVRDGEADPGGGRLRASGATVTYHDPLVPEFCEVEPPLKSLSLTAKLVQSQDAVVIVTDHRCVNYGWLVRHARLVVDTRNATRNVRRGRQKIVKL